MSCPSGEGFFVGHDSVCATYCALAAGADGIPGAQAAWKPRVDAWPRSTRGAEADAGFFRLPGSRDTYVDAVCSYANPVTYRGCDSTAGTVAEWKARKKNAEHPVFDAQNHRRLHPFDFRALSLSGTATGLKKPSVSQKNSPLLVPPLSVLIRLPKFVAGTESSLAACNVPTRKFCVVNQCRGAIQRFRPGAFFL